MIKGSVDSIETFGLVDGPGIRSVVFLSGCKLRCKYCHNPEMWVKGKENYTPEELVAKLLRNKPYFKRNQGGVTFSGGEPLLQSKFLIEVCKFLKQEDIHIALDTSGVGVGDYEEVLPYIDLVLFDVKHVEEEGYFNLVNQSILESLKFIDCLNKTDIRVWIRQVIVPDVTDSESYIKKLAEFLKKFKHIEKIELLPYHKLGDEKYIKLGISNPYSEKIEMNQDRVNELYLLLQKYLL